MDCVFLARCELAMCGSLAGAICPGPEARHGVGQACNGGGPRVWHTEGDVSMPSMGLVKGVPILRSGNNGRRVIACLLHLTKIVRRIALHVISA